MKVSIVSRSGETSDHSIYSCPILKSTISSWPPEVSTAWFGAAVPSEQAEGIAPHHHPDRTRPRRVLERVPELLHHLHHRVRARWSHLCLLRGAIRWESEELEIDVYAWRTIVSAQTRVLKRSRRTFAGVVIRGESETDRRADVPALGEVRRAPETGHELVKEVRDVDLVELAVERGRRGEAVSRESGYDDMVTEVYIQQPHCTLASNLGINSRKGLMGVSRHHHLEKRQELEVAPRPTMRHDDRLRILSRRRQRREMDAILEPIGVLDRPHERRDSIDPLLLCPPRTSPRRYQRESRALLNTS